MGRRPTFPLDTLDARSRARVLAEADLCMQAAREQVSRAALACLRNKLDAGAQVRLALDLVEQARGLLARVASSAEA